MKTLTDVQIIISEDNTVSYNYNGTLWTKEQFEEQFLPKSKKFIVIYTDFGDTCDGFARVSGTYKTLDEAKKDMLKDIEWYRRDNDLPYTVEQDDRILLGDEFNGCQWQILEIEV